MLLENKTAIVYGAAGAIGSAVARAYAREGAGVHLAGRDIDSLNRVAETILDAGGANAAEAVKLLSQLRGDGDRSEATTIALAAIVVGIPLGVVAGRQLWTLYARQVGVLALPVTPIAALGAIAILAVLLANIVARFPARAAARGRLVAGTVRARCGRRRPSPGQ